MNPLALVTDDDFTVRILAREALEQAGFDVLEAENGIQALDIFHQKRPEIILMDVKMPMMDGFEACRNLRSMPGGENVPILMITGADDVESIQIAYETGATDFMSKPVNWLILTQRVRYMLRAGRNAERLRRSEAGLAAAQRIARMGSWEMDLETRIFRRTPETCRIYGFEYPVGVEDIEDLTAPVHPDDLEPVRKSFAQLRHRSISFKLDHRIVLPDGSVRFVQQQAGPSQDDQGDFRRIIGTVQDITERKLAETLEADRNSILQMILRNESSGEIMDAMVRIIEQQKSDALCAITVLKERHLYLQAYSRSASLLFQIMDGIEVNAEAGTCSVIAAYTGNSFVVGDISASRLQDQTKNHARQQGVCSCGSIPIISGKGQILGTVSIFFRKPHCIDDRVVQFMDVIANLAAIAIERNRLSEELVHHAHHDMLTGLPNRAALTEFLTQKIRVAVPDKDELAVFYIDFDRFKQINDSLGHLTGDRLLKKITQRLENCLKDKGRLGRMAGDEFMLITNALASASSVSETAQDILDVLTPPFQIGERDLYLSASIGISLFPKDGDDAVSLQKNADMAMFHAKNAGGNRYRFFADEMNEAAIERLEIENELIKTVETGNFELHYQPKYHLGKNTLESFEALIRWNHPTLGRIPPCKFIPIAEESQQIIPIGTWVLREACRRNAEWERKGFGKCRIAVNVSVVQFFQENFVDLVQSTLEEFHLEPRRLELELTESMVSEDMNFLIQRLAELKSVGVCTTIDDFGTGYSSMSYLHRLPINCLKIDQSFVRKLVGDDETSRRSRAMIQSMVHLGHELNLSVVAEGIESQEHLGYLTRIGCDIGQGFFFSMPIPADEVEMKIFGNKDRIL